MSYTYIKAGSSSDDCDTLTGSVNSKLFFAGEHTNFDFIGTVHGAYISGQRAAQQALSAYLIKSVGLIALLLIGIINHAV